MTSNGHVTGDPDEQDDTAHDERADPYTAAPLAHRVVEYPTGPDRCTVYPPGLSNHARMTTWMTVNADTFVDLVEWR